MFFRSKVVEALEADHKPIKKEIKIIGDIEKSRIERSEALDRLVPTLMSHTEREEFAVYTYMKKLSGDFAEMALEGEKEHRMVVELIDELRSDTLEDVEWSAQCKILAELIELHIGDEEQDVFPELRKQLDKETDAYLCERYLRGSRAEAA